MHILLFHDSVLPPKNYGGIERIVVTLADEYARRGHKVSVLARKGSKLEGTRIEGQSKRLPAPRMIEIPDKWPSPQIEDILPDDIDFIHSHQPLGAEPKRPYLVTIHGNGYETEKYLPNTNFLSQSHARNHSSQIYVFNGVDSTRYTFSDKKEDYYLFLARTTWRVKNLKTAIAWANDLNVKLKIIGGRGVSRGNIEYLGFVDDEAKNLALSRAKALIYPTNWDEPCAGAPLESLACGTPVISTRNGCMPEMVNDQTGVICDSYAELLKAPEKLKSVSYKKCREMAESVFSVSRMADDYLKLFERIRRDGKLVDENNLPHYNFKKESVRYLYKPTLVNKLRLMATGKI